MDHFEQTMYWLLAGSKGAFNRVKIIELIDSRPRNLNELSKEIGLNYKTVKHHIDILVENQVLVTRGEKYGQVLFLSPQMDEKKSLFKKLLAESIVRNDSHGKK